MSNTVVPTIPTLMMKSELIDENATKLAMSISRQLSSEMAIHNEHVATQLVDSTKALANDLVQSNEKVAQKLVDYNASLAVELATTNRIIAEKLVVATQHVAKQLLEQNKDIARQIEITTSSRFERQKAWSWSLIATNGLICLILLFFAVAFSRYAVQALMQ